MRIAHTNNHAVWNRNSVVKNAQKPTNANVSNIVSDINQKMSMNSPKITLSKRGKALLKEASLHGDEIMDYRALSEITRISNDRLEAYKKQLEDYQSLMDERAQLQKEADEAVNYFYANYSEDMIEDNKEFTTVAQYCTPARTAYNNMDILSKRLEELDQKIDQYLEYRNTDFSSIGRMTQRSMKASLSLTSSAFQNNYGDFFRMDDSIYFLERDRENFLEKTGEAITSLEQITDSLNNAWESCLGTKEHQVYIKDLCRRLDEFYGQMSERENKTINILLKYNLQFSDEAYDKVYHMLGEGYKPEEVDNLIRNSDDFYSFFHAKA